MSSDGSKVHNEHRDEMLDRIQTAASISLSPELFEQLYLAPQNQVKGQLRQTYGNPTPVALGGFLLCTTPISMALLEWQGAGGFGAGANVGSYFYLGGLLLVLGGIGEWILGNTFPATVFCLFGGFWLTFGATIVPGYGAYGLYSTTGAAADGLNEQQFYATFSFFLVAMTILCAVFTVASIRTNVVLFTILLLLIPTFSCLSASFFAVSHGLASSAKTYQHVGAGLLLAVSFLGWYIFLAQVLLSLKIVPLGTAILTAAPHADDGRSRRRRFIALTPVSPQCKHLSWASDDTSTNPANWAPDKSIGRRSSDAVSAASTEYPYSDSGIRPCSYCVKTKKQCTPNSHWGEARSLQTGQSSSSATDSRGDVSLRPKRQRTDHHTMISTSLPDSKSLDLSSSILHLLQSPSPSQHAFAWEAAIPSLECNGALPPDNPFGPLGIDLGLGSDEGDSQTGSSNLAFGANSGSVGRAHQRLDSVFDSTVYSGSQDSELDFQVWDFSQSCSEPRNPSFSAQPTPNSSNGVWNSRRRRRPSDEWPENSRTSPSSLDPDYEIMATSNNQIITKSLLQIYHDVLENNLACWLSEDTCPYNMEERRRGFHHMGAVYAAEFKPWNGNTRPAVWPNRIYQRVLRLDRVAQSTKMIRLTRAENQAASRALDLVIMAFATQWAQGNRRREQYSSRPLDSPDTNQDDYDDMAKALNDEFEQNLQQSIWEQAKKALQDVSELESYRVIYAELIFGLIQRPWASSDHSPINIPATSPKSIKDSILPPIMDIMAKEGPPVHMQRAIHKIHALKFSLDANETGFKEASQQSINRQEADLARGINAEERRTIGLIYWLAVMFDTVASSMSERPVALADEDCQHEAESKVLKPAASSAKSYLGRHRWKLNLFVQDNPEKPSLSLHWPCPPDIAANAVARSAPVKIVLFRHLAYLQNALRKKEYGQPIEDIIRSVTLLYRYWNMTHGGFFRELVKNYSSVPQRIRSWFFCIAVPWHLGSLMLADLIDFVDSNALGLEESTLRRLDSGMTSRIRKASATDLSDLARVTSPPINDDGSTPEEQLPDLHFAVNEGPLLTEPWTIILIRAFTKASVFHLSVADDLKQNEWAILGHDSEEFQDSLRRSENCIRALWCLGKKSEMARNITKVLSQALHAQRT
ncbi:hypothetical protein G7Z17_g3437 [Cylindrodendrum hubeiense]|uniref:Uncharacterized protein n=1 Tax=Cylindrodendrum hubeiense TaxID=595255 RepID=A0A9P5HHW9_9HYPO|nr:hypothetical protein G7Z17_g3437 [Cylindrodendrum hubeiense]